MVANLLFDWITDRIDDPETYNWPADCQPYFGTVKDGVTDGKCDIYTASDSVTAAEKSVIELF